MAMTASGSVWNQNSWHWEEKSYTQWAKNEINNLITSFTLHINSSEFTFKNVISKGEASVSIRKGKLICSFEFEIWADWTAKNNNEISNGNLHISDFSFESVKDNDYELEIRSKGNTEFDKNSKNLFSKNSTKFRNNLDVFLTNLEQAEANERKVKEAKARQAEEKEIMKKAEYLKGQEKQKIAEEQKSKENEKKQQQTSDLPQKISVKGEGSVWNVNSYHWEEKPMTKWSIDTLKDKFLNKNLKLLDDTTEVQFFNPIIKGEASNTIRKGKKLVIYDLKISSDWKATARNSSGQFLADANGKFEIVEFTSEDDVCDVQIIYTFDNHLSCQERLNKAMETEGKQKIHTLLNEFVDELKRKG